jgi:hypothetical protein
MISVEITKVTCEAAVADSKKKHFYVVFSKSAELGT